MQCPECAKKGLVQYLRFHYLSFTESVEKCNLSTCMYPFSRFRYRNYHDHTVYRYERVPAALIVQSAPETLANDTKELLDTFNLNWLDDPDEGADDNDRPDEQTIEDYSFGDAGLTNFLNMVNDSVNNSYDINAIIDDICKDATNTSAGDDEEYTLLELKTFSKPTAEIDVPISIVDGFIDSPEPSTLASPTLPSPPIQSIATVDTTAVPAKPRKRKARNTKPIENGFKFNIIRTSTTSSSSSSSSSEATSDHIPKLSKCLAQIRSISAQVSASSSPTIPNTNAVNQLKRDQHDVNAQLKTILEQQHNFRPMDIMDSLNNINFKSATISALTRSQPLKDGPSKAKSSYRAKSLDKQVVPSKAKASQPSFGESFKTHKVEGGSSISGDGLRKLKARKPNRKETIKFNFTSQAISMLPEPEDTPSVETKIIATPKNIIPSTVTSILIEPKDAPKKCKKRKLNTSLTTSSPATPESLQEVAKQSEKTLVNNIVQSAATSTLLKTEDIKDRPTEVKPNPIETASFQKTVSSIPPQVPADPEAAIVNPFFGFSSPSEVRSEPAEPQNSARKLTTTINVPVDPETAIVQPFYGFTRNDLRPRRIRK